MKQQQQEPGSRDALLLVLSLAALAICSTALLLANWVALSTLNAVIALIGLTVVVGGIGVWIGGKSVLVGAAILAVATSSLIQGLAFSKRQFGLVCGAARNIAVREMAEHLREFHAEETSGICTNGVEGVCR